MRPIGNLLYPAVLYRVPMDIVSMAPEVVFIPNEMFPETSLPNPRSPRFRRLSESRSPFSMEREKFPLIKPQRVEKSESPGGKVQMQCKCSGKITAASIRNEWTACTERNTDRSVSTSSTSRRFPFRSARLTVKNHVAPGAEGRRYCVIGV